MQLTLLRRQAITGTSTPALAILDFLLLYPSRSLIETPERAGKGRVLYAQEPTIPQPMETGLINGARHPDPIPYRRTNHHIRPTSGV
jgi:hypothetical protein